MQTTASPEFGPNDDEDNNPDIDAATEAAMGQWGELFREADEAINNGQGDAVVDSAGQSPTVEELVARLDNGQKISDAEFEGLLRGGQPLEDRPDGEEVA